MQSFVILTSYITLEFHNLTHDLFPHTLVLFCDEIYFHVYSVLFCLHVKMSNLRLDHKFNKLTNTTGLGCKKYVKI